MKSGGSPRQLHIRKGCRLHAQSLRAVLRRCLLAAVLTAMLTTMLLLTQQLLRWQLMLRWQLVLTWVVGPLMLLLGKELLGNELSGILLIRLVGELAVGVGVSPATAPCLGWLGCISLLPLLVFIVARLQKRSKL